MGAGNKRPRPEDRALKLPVDRPTAGLRKQPASTFLQVEETVLGQAVFNGFLDSLFKVTVASLVSRRWLAGGLHYVTALDLHQTKITDEVLLHVVCRRYPALETLDLRWCDGLTGEGLSCLGQLSSLRVLNLRGCTAISDGDLAALVCCPLQELELTGCLKVTDRALRVLKEIPQLERLRLSMCHQITDEGLALFQRSALKELEVACCARLTDKAMASIATLSHLEFLDISGCRFISDLGLAFLRQIPHLEQLLMSHLPLVTEGGLRFLLCLSELQVLDLRGSQALREEFLKSLTALPKLHTLDVSCCERLTMESLERARKLFRPEVEIIDSFPRFPLKPLLDTVTDQPQVEAGGAEAATTLT